VRVGHPAGLGEEAGAAQRDGEQGGGRFATTLRPQ
jgi:hypothetical protein